MDLKIFFDKIDEPIFETIQDNQSFFESIRIHSNQFPKWKDADMAIVGLVEDRGNIYNHGLDAAANEIRRKLYRLKKPSRRTKLVDLGNLRNGLKLEDTYLRVCEVCEILLTHNVIPILIGGSHDMDYGQFLAYQKFEKLISITNVDAVLDLENTPDKGHNKHHTHRILMHEPNMLFNFANIGYQTFLNDQEMLNILEQLYFENHRIGQVKFNIEESEPIIRQADMISFDITSVRISDAPGNPNATPFGFTGEEACQLAWYAGLNSKLSSIGIYEYNPMEDIKGQTASLIGAMIWYFVEGYNQRINDQDYSGPNFLKFIVDADTQSHKITFYKNKMNEMWWMEVPYPASKGKKPRTTLVPCSYTDYEAAMKGELPGRWISTHAKLM